MRTYTVKTIKPKFGRVELPLDHLLAIYARQSRAEQVENNPESFQMQTQGLLKTALDLCWKPELIHTFIENEKAGDKWKNASGAKRLDERPKLQEIVGLIEQDIVKAVLVFLVDRLFRDEDRTEAGVFARICREHQCIVLTSEGDMFDFTNRRDYDRFIDEAKAGGDFITHYLKGRALPARRQKALRGEYDGRSVPVGFTVERRVKGLVRRYVIYEPHAEVVRWIFKRYRELSGNFALLYRELCARPYIFPLYQTGEYIPHTTLGRNSQGYILTKPGLKGLLTNVAYIGYWYVDGAELRKDNHPAIVDEGDFWYAFDRLSPVTIDGEPREQHIERARFNRLGTLPADALLNGIVTSENEYTVYVIQHAEKPSKACYTITNNNHYGATRTLGSIQVAKLDALFTTRMFEKLEAGKQLRQQFAGTQWENKVGGLESHMAKQLIDVAKAQQQQTAGITSQIADYTEEADSLDRLLHYGAKALDEKTIEKKATRLGNLRRSIDQLKAKLNRAQRAQEDLQKFVERLDDIPAVWHEMGKEDGTTYEKQQRFIRLVTNSMTLTRVAPNWLCLDIAWLSTETPNSVCYIWQQHGNGKSWTDEENHILTYAYPHADRLQLLKALPTRNWSAIMIQARRLGLSRPYSQKNSGLPIMLSMDDATFMQEHGISYAPGVHTWWQDVEVEASYDGTPSIYTEESPS
jgi:DNA invertase Pin-like site-specific DNA recombinase